MKKSYCYRLMASLCTWLLLLTTLNSFAQSKTITGKVLSNTGTPLSNVSVVVKGTSQGTTSDANGTYTISVPQESSVLVFSYAGMELQEQPVAGKTTINVDFKPLNNTLTEVVLIGYGSVQKRDLTSAVSTISSKDFLQGGVNSPLQMIDGKVAGVTISNPAAADPNRSADVQVRGAAHPPATRTRVHLLAGTQHPVLERALQSATGLHLAAERNVSALARFGQRRH
ncbi:MAG: hypothetical protein EOP50_13420 [Sphingobacteriales bacterium]|nr:MAG: hypothetical protein EOP50_13420 [Sphingobacteriales bacterium]